MGSYSSLDVGHLSLSENKGDFNPYLMALFQEGEKLLMPLSQEEWNKASEANDEELDMEQFKFVYQSNLGSIRDRLSLIGINEELVRKYFDIGRQSTIEALERDDVIPAMREWHQLDLEALASMNFDQWCDDVKHIYQNALDVHFRYEDFPSGVSNRIRFMLTYPRSEMLGFPFEDYNMAMYAMSIALQSDTPVVYDLTSLTLGGYLTVDEPWVEIARSQLRHSHELAQKIIVLTEGRSDRYAIEEALSILRPSIKDFYSFMDFDGFRVPGGASALVTSLKALVGAGVVNRILAIFDNDTAAHSSFRALRSVSLPSNVKILHLPQVEHCMHYPTIGPTGMLPMNINGLASSIELFFGTDILLAGEDYTAIQWRGYDEGMSQYQGEIMHKEQLFEKFRAKVVLAKADLSARDKQDWSSMQVIVDMMMHAFSGSYVPAQHTL